LREGVGGEECGHLFDPRATEREYLDAVCSEGLGSFVPEVAAESGLRVRARGYEAPALLVWLSLTAFVGDAD